MDNLSLKDKKILHEEFKSDWADSADCKRRNFYLQAFEKPNGEFLLIMVSENCRRIYHQVIESGADDDLKKAQIIGLIKLVADMQKLNEMNVFLIVHTGCYLDLTDIDDCLVECKVKCYPEDGKYFHPAKLQIERYAVKFGALI